MIKKTLIGFGLLLNMCLCVVIIMYIMYYNGAFTNLTPQKTTEELVATVKIYFIDNEEPYLERAVIVDYDKVITGAYSNVEKITYLDRENQCEIPLIEVNHNSSLNLKAFQTENGEILNADVNDYLKTSAQLNNASAYHVGYWRKGSFCTENADRLDFSFRTEDNVTLLYLTMNNQKIYAPVIDKYGRFAGITVPCKKKDVLAIIPAYYIYRMLE